MRYEFKSIRIWSFIKIAFFVNLVFGFLLGLFYAFLIPVMLMAPGPSPFQGMGLESEGGSFIFMLILFPIMFAAGCSVFQTILFTIIAASYNLFARMVGGVEFDIQPTEQMQPLAQPQTPMAPDALVAPVVYAQPAAAAPPPPPMPQATPQPPVEPQTPSAPAPRPEVGQNPPEDDKPLS